MSKEKVLKVNEYSKWNQPETPETNINELNNELFYNCSECSSMIEIISINEENNTIEFKCLNKNKTHPDNNIMTIKEYLTKMKKYNNSKLNNDVCEIHNNKYVNFCFDCNCHLCKDCLKTRNHLFHMKNNIIEIEPMKEEINIINEILIYYEDKIDNLMREKLKKVNELKITLNNNKKEIKDKYDEIIKINEKRKEKELKINHINYINDINKIINNCKNELKLRKIQYLNDNNKSKNKYKLINEKENLIYTKKINELTIKYNEEINNTKLDEQIINLTNIKRLDEIVLNTYNMYNNNYYNAKNINSILLRYIKNDCIKNKMKQILKDKYNEIFEIIQRKNNADININIQKEKEKKIDIIEKELENMKNENKKLLKSLSETKNEMDKISTEYKMQLDKKNKEYEDEIKKLKCENEFQLSLKSEEYKNYKARKDKAMEIYQESIRELKEKNKTNIKKFEEYLKILEKRISYVKNEITIIYKINKNENFVKIFDEDFVKDKKDYCKILYEGKEYELQENFDVKNITDKNSELLEIKLKVEKKIKSFYSMFYKCTSLLYLPDISKFDTSNFTSLTDMFCDCSSLLFLPDISKWNISKVERLSEMFDGCSSLMFLPDISKWDTSNVLSMNSTFANCKSLVYLPDISKWNISKVEKKSNMFKDCDKSLIIPEKFK